MSDSSAVHDELLVCRTREMKTILIVLIAFGAALAAESNMLNRFLVVPRTITTTVTTTTTVSSTTTSTAVCFSIALNSTTNSTVACARRRRQLPIVELIEEDNEDIDASEPLAMTATAAPRAVDMKPDAAHATPSSEVQLASSIQSTDGLAEVIINDMESICRARVANPQFSALAQLFSITLLTTSTSTSTATSTSLVTSVTTKTAVLGCNPSAFTSLKTC